MYRVIVSAAQPGQRWAYENGIKSTSSDGGVEWALDNTTSRFGEFQVVTTTRKKKAQMIKQLEGVTAEIVIGVCRAVQACRRPRV
jgi:hypothetical protein